MKTDGLNISRRNVLRLGGGIMALAGSAPFSALMAAPANLADLPYTVNIVNTSSNATLVLQALLDLLPGTLHVKDRELRYCVANRNYLERWGAKAEAVIGRG